MIETRVNNELIDEIYTALGEASGLSAASYNCGLLDAGTVDSTGVTLKEYERCVNKTMNQFRRIRKKLKKLLKSS